jgi:cell division septum initiation protein DivIVA
MSDHDEPYDAFDDPHAYEDDTALPDEGSTLLLRRAIDIVANAKPLPLSSSVRIEPEEMLDLLERALDAEPEEVRQARWLLKERDEFLAKVRREADEIIEDAKARAAHLVSRQEIVKDAKRTANKLVDDAESDSRRRKREAEDWCDQQLAKLELTLDRIAKTTQAGRERLRVKLEPAGAEPADGLDLAEDQTSASFFDQDHSR